MAGHPEPSRAGLSYRMGSPGDHRLPERTVGAAVSTCGSPGLDKVPGAQERLLSSLAVEQPTRSAC